MNNKEFYAEFSISQLRYVLRRFYLYKPKTTENDIAIIKQTTLLI